MITYLLFVATLACSGISSVLGKKFQMGVKNNLPTMIMYNMINAIFGTLYFFVLCRFRIEMNMITFIFSVIYALLVINSLAMGVVSLSKVSIPFNAIIGMAGSVTGSTFFGVVLFGEAITLKQIAAMLLLISAVAVTALTSPELRHKNNSVVVCIWNFLTAFLGSPFIKIYTVTPGVLEINNMFFMTNFLAAALAAVYVVVFVMTRDRSLAKANFVGVTSRPAILNIASRTALSNISSVIGAIIVAGMDLTLYNILSSSLGLVLNGCISKFIFRESLTRQNYISILLALIAIIVKTI